MKTSTLRSVVECRRQLGFPDITARYFGDFEFTLFSKNSCTARLGLRVLGDSGSSFYFEKKSTNLKILMRHCLQCQIQGRFSRKGTLKDLDALLFSDSNLKVLRSPNLHHLRHAVGMFTKTTPFGEMVQECKTSIFKFDKFIFQSSDLEDQ